jgi:DNA-binding transcriptional regulator WhiA
MSERDGKASWDWSVAECIAHPAEYIESAHREITALQAAGAVANRRRCVQAAARTVPEARRAARSLDLYPAQPQDRCMHTEYRAVLLLRAAMPDATLAELADTMGLSKDAYAAQLRRALQYARRLEAAQ